MKIKSFDIVVIGSGPAGEKAAMEAAALGAQVAVIEKKYNPGGASVLTGTLPSKSLRETVQYVNSLTNKSLSGLEINLDRKLTINELMHRKKVVVKKRVNYILEAYKYHKITYLHGEGRFISDHEVEVIPFDDEEPWKVRGDKIIIAVGTNPYHPDDIQFDGKRILDSDSILGLAFIPDELTIYGGGVIGCEYASIFAKIGTRVTLVDPRGRLLDFIDHDISDVLYKLMESYGIEFKLGETYKTVQANGENVRVELASGEMFETEKFLFANGRQGLANTLNVEACGLVTDKRCQLEVNGNYQTQVPHIYAVGDVIGFPSLVSVSNEEGRLASRHAVLGESVKRIGGDIPYGIYTIPEMATIGFSEQALKEKNVPYEVGLCHFNQLARGYIIGEQSGILKLLFDKKSRLILGAHILGQSASELIHIAQAVMKLNGTIDYFVDNVFNFPTLSLAYKVAAKDGLCRLGEITETLICQNSYN